MHPEKPAGEIIILMGVSGSGKPTVGRLRAERLGIPFHDAAAFHPAAHIAKMAAGPPLTDDDRRGWLAAALALKESYPRRSKPGSAPPAARAFPPKPNRRKPFTNSWPTWRPLPC